MLGMHVLRPAYLLSLALLRVWMGGHIEPPNFITSPRNQTVAAGQVGVFFCAAAGHPQPQIEWRKSGRRVSNTSRYTLTETAKGLVLRIDPVRARTDNADFQCRAVNGVGEPALTNFTLTVLEESNLPPRFPNFKLLPKTLVVQRNRSALLHCKAEGTPEPTITWLHNGLLLDKSNPRYSLNTEGSLLIDDVQEEDQGRYECVAENSAGTAISPMAILYVRDRRVLPYFSDKPKATYQVSPGATLNLTCEAVGSPMPYVRWRKGDIDLTPENETTVGRNLLVLQNVRESANYTCVAISSLGTIEHVSELLVKGEDGSTPLVSEGTHRQLPPYFSDQPKSTYQVSPGATLNLTCAALGSPMPHLRWRKGDTYLTPESDVTVGSNLLVLENVRESANYTCVATSSLGSIQQISQVLVQEPSSIIILPRNQTVAAGQVAVFFCTAAGHPQPKIEWRKKGRRVSNTSRYTLTETAKGLVLRIDPVRARTDNADFECRALNGVGETVLANFTLTVLEENDLPPGFPSFKLLPKTQVVQRNRSALVQCKAEGIPEPTITWLHNGFLVDMSNPRYSLTTDGSLQIDDVQEEDQGRYECVAENSVGTAISPMAFLYFRDRPVLPYFTDKPESTYEVSPGATFNLTCMAIGSPMPHVRWRKGDIDLIPDSEVTVGLNLLLLENVHESANYTCVASSSLGSIEHVSQVLVREQVASALRDPQRSPT